MARPPDDDGTEAYMDEAATIIYNSLNMMIIFMTAIVRLHDVGLCVEAVFFLRGGHVMRRLIVWRTVCEVCVRCRRRGVEGRAGWRGWTKLTMARPSDDDGTEAYIDEAATIN